MIKLKDLLFETKVAHTQKSLQWVAQGFIPMYPKIMKKVLGDVPITALHNIDWYNAKVMLPKVLGKKKSISTYTALKNTNLSIGGGVQTSGGIILEVEGKVLIAGTEDLGSVPDESGRRWINPSIFGEIVGMKQFVGGGGHIYYKKNLYKIDKKLEDILFRYQTSLLTMNDEERQQYPLYNNKQKAELIKRWIDASNKFLLKNKKKIKDTFMKNINNPKTTTDRYGWNELLVYDTKVKDAFIVLDALAAPGDHEGLEKSLKHVKGILKSYVKGKIYSGFSDVAKKFIKQRGGKV
tara:strand:- start:50 stop:931 length:882 start_codon:yes stop_codon:yes gene_type:complete